MGILLKVVSYEPLVALKRVFLSSSLRFPGYHFSSTIAWSSYNIFIFLMLNIKIAAFALLVTCLFAAKNLTVTCGTCTSSPSNCSSSICYFYSGPGLTSFQSCTNTTQCDITGNTTVVLTPCTLDFQGMACSANTCFYANAATTNIMTNNANCTGTTYTVADSCTGNSNCTGATPNCTSCLQVNSTQSGPVVTTNVCASSYNTTCYNFTTTVSVATCTKDSFGVASSCCTTYGFSAANNNALCSNTVSVLGSPDAKAKLVAWVSESIVLLSAFLFVATFMI